MTQTVSECQLILDQGGELTPQCRAVLGLTSSPGGSGEGGIAELVGPMTDTQKIMNALKLNQFAENYPMLLPGGFLVQGIAALNNMATQASVPTYGQGGVDNSGGQWSLSPPNAAGDSGLTWSGPEGHTFSTNKTYASDLSPTGTFDFTQD